MIESTQYRVTVDKAEQRGLGLIDIQPPPQAQTIDSIYDRLCKQAKSAHDVPTGCVMKPIEHKAGIRFLIVPSIAPAKLKWLGQHAVEVLRFQTGTHPNISFGSALEAASQNSKPDDGTVEVKVSPEYL